MATKERNIFASLLGNLPSPPVHLKAAGKREHNDNLSSIMADKKEAPCVSSEQNQRQDLKTDNNTNKVASTTSTKVDAVLKIGGKSLMQSISRLQERKTFKLNYGLTKKAESSSKETGDKSSDSPPRKPKRGLLGDFPSPIISGKIDTSVPPPGISPVNDPCLLSPGIQAPGSMKNASVVPISINTSVPPPPSVGLPIQGPCLHDDMPPLLTSNDQGYNSVASSSHNVPPPPLPPIGLPPPPPQPPSNGLTSGGLLSPPPQLPHTNGLSGCGLPPPPPQPPTHSNGLSPRVNSITQHGGAEYMSQNSVPFTANIHIPPPPIIHDTHSEDNGGLSYSQLPPPPPPNSQHPPLPPGPPSSEPFLSPPLFRTVPSLPPQHAAQPPLPQSDYQQPPLPPPESNVDELLPFPHSYKEKTEHVRYGGNGNGNRSHISEYSPFTAAGNCVDRSSSSNFSHFSVRESDSAPSTTDNEYMNRNSDHWTRGAEFEHNSSRERVPNLSQRECKRDINGQPIESYHTSAFNRRNERRYEHSRNNDRPFDTPFANKGAANNGHTISPNKRKFSRFHNDWSGETTEFSGSPPKRRPPLLPTPKMNIDTPFASRVRSTLKSLGGNLDKPADNPILQNRSVKSSNIPCDTRDRSGMGLKEKSADKDQMTSKVEVKEVGNELQDEMPKLEAEGCKTHKSPVETQYSSPPVLEHSMSLDSVASMNCSNINPSENITSVKVKPSKQHNAHAKDKLHDEFLAKLKQSMGTHGKAKNSKHRHKSVDSCTSYDENVNRKNRHKSFTIPKKKTKSVDIPETENEEQRAVICEKKDNSDSQTLNYGSDIEMKASIQQQDESLETTSTAENTIIDAEQKSNVVSQPDNPSHGNVMQEPEKENSRVTENKCVKISEPLPLQLIRVAEWITSSVCESTILPDNANSSEKPISTLDPTKIEPVSPSEIVHSAASTEHKVCVKEEHSHENDKDMQQFTTSVLKIDKYEHKDSKCKDSEDIKCETNEIKERIDHPFSDDQSTGDQIMPAVQQSSVTLESNESPNDAVSRDSRPNPQVEIVCSIPLDSLRDVTSSYNIPGIDIVNNNVVESQVEVMEPTESHDDSELGSNHTTNSLNDAALNDPESIANDAESKLNEKADKPEVVGGNRQTYLNTELNVTEFSFPISDESNAVEIEVEQEVSEKNISTCSDDNSEIEISSEVHTDNVSESSESSLDKELSNELAVDNLPSCTQVMDKDARNVQSSNEENVVDTQCDEPSQSMETDISNKDEDECGEDNPSNSDNERKIEAENREEQDAAVECTLHTEYDTPDDVNSAQRHKSLDISNENESNKENISESPNDVALNTGKDKGAEESDNDPEISNQPDANTDKDEPNEIAERALNGNDNMRNECEIGAENAIIHEKHSEHVVFATERSQNRIASDVESVADTVQYAREETAQSDNTNDTSADYIEEQSKLSDKQGCIADQNDDDLKNWGSKNVPGVSSQNLPDHFEDAQVCTEDAEIRGNQVDFVNGTEYDNEESSFTHISETIKQSSKQNSSTDIEEQMTSYAIVPASPIADESEMSNNSHDSAERISKDAANEVSYGDEQNVTGDQHSDESDQINDSEVVTDDEGNILIASVSSQITTIVSGEDKWDVFENQDDAVILEATDNDPMSEVEETEMRHLSEPLDCSAKQLDTSTLSNSGEVTETEVIETDGVTYAESSQIVDFEEEVCVYGQEGIVEFANVEVAECEIPLTTAEESQETTQNDGESRLEPENSNDEDADRQIPEYLRILTSGNVSHILADAISFKRQRSDESSPNSGVIARDSFHFDEGIDIQSHNRPVEECVDTKLCNKPVGDCVDSKLHKKNGTKKGKKKRKKCDFKKIFKIQKRRKLTAKDAKYMPDFHIPILDIKKVCFSEIGRIPDEQHHLSDIHEKGRDKPSASIVTDRRSPPPNHGTVMHPGYPELENDSTPLVKNGRILKTCHVSLTDIKDIHPSMSSKNETSAEVARVQESVDETLEETTSYLEQNKEYQRNVSVDNDETTCDQQYQQLVSADSPEDYRSGEISPVLSTTEDLFERGITPTNSISDVDEEEGQICKRQRSKKYFKDEQGVKKTKVSTSDAVESQLAETTDINETSSQSPDESPIVYEHVDESLEHLAEHEKIGNQVNDEKTHDYDLVYAHDYDNVCEHVDESIEHLAEHEKIVDQVEEENTHDDDRSEQIRYAPEKMEGSEHGKVSEERLSEDEPVNSPLLNVQNTTNGAAENSDDIVKEIDENIFTEETSRNSESPNVNEGVDSLHRNDVAHESIPVSGHQNDTCDVAQKVLNEDELNSGVMVATPINERDINSEMCDEESECAERRNTPDLDSPRENLEENTTKEAGISMNVIEEHNTDFDEEVPQIETEEQNALTDYCAKSLSPACHDSQLANDTQHDDFVKEHVSQVDEHHSEDDTSVEAVGKMCEENENTNEALQSEDPVEETTESKSQNEDIEEMVEPSTAEENNEGLASQESLLECNTLGQNDISDMGNECQGCLNSPEFDMPPSPELQELKQNKITDADDSTQSSCETLRNNDSGKKNIISDVFLDKGSTMIAAEGDEEEKINDMTHPSSDTEDIIPSHSDNCHSLDELNESEIPQETLLGLEENEAIPFTRERVAFSKEDGTSEPLSKTSLIGNEESMQMPSSGEGQGHVTQCSDESVTQNNTESQDNWAMSKEIKKLLDMNEHLNAEPRLAAGVTPTASANINNPIPENGTSEPLPNDMSAGQNLATNGASNACPPQLSGDIIMMSAITSGILDDSDYSTVGSNIDENEINPFDNRLLNEHITTESRESSRPMNTNELDMVLKEYQRMKCLYHDILAREYLSSICMQKIQENKLRSEQLLRALRRQLYPAAIKYQVPAAELDIHILDDISRTNPQFEAELEHKVREMMTTMNQQALDLNKMAENFGPEIKGAYMQLNQQYSSVSKPLAFLKDIISKGANVMPMNQPQRQHSERNRGMRPIHQPQQATPTVEKPTRNHNGSKNLRSSSNVRSLNIANECESFADISRELGNEHEYHVSKMPNDSSNEGALLHIKEKAVFDQRDSTQQQHKQRTHDVPVSNQSYANGNQINCYDSSKDRKLQQMSDKPVSLKNPFADDTDRCVNNVAASPITKPSHSFMEIAGQADQDKTPVAQVRPQRIPKQPHVAHVKPFKGQLPYDAGTTIPVPHIPEAVQNPYMVGNPPTNPQFLDLGSMPARPKERTHNQSMSSRHHETAHVAPSNNPSAHAMHAMHTNNPPVAHGFDPRIHSTQASAVPISDFERHHTKATRKEFIPNQPDLRTPSTNCSVPNQITKPQKSLATSIPAPTANIPGNAQMRFFQPMAFQPNNRPATQTNLEKSAKSKPVQEPPKPASNLQKAHDVPRIGPITDDASRFYHPPFMHGMEGFPRIQRPIANHPRMNQATSEHAHLYNMGSKNEFPCPPQPFLQHPSFMPNPAMMDQNRFFLPPYAPNNEFLQRFPHMPRPMHDAFMQPRHPSNLFMDQLGKTPMAPMTDKPMASMGHFAHQMSSAGSVHERPNAAITSMHRQPFNPNQPMGVPTSYSKPEQEKREAGQSSSHSSPMDGSIPRTSRAPAFTNDIHRMPQASHAPNETFQMMHHNPMLQQSIGFDRDAMKIKSHSKQGPKTSQSDTPHYTSLQALENRRQTQQFPSAGLQPPHFMGQNYMTERTEALRYGNNQMRDHQSNAPHGFTYRDRPVEPQSRTDDFQASQASPSLPNPCACCGKEALFLCSGCKRVSYCTVECQGKQWMDHKHNCIMDRQTSNKKVSNDNPLERL